MPKPSGAISVKEKNKGFSQAPLNQSLSWFPRSMKRLGVLQLPPLDGMLVHREVSPPPLHFIRLPWQFTSTFLYSWGERGMLRLKCFVQEQTHWPSRVSNPDLWTRSPVHWPLCHCVLHIYITDQKKTHPLPTLLYTAFGSSLMMGFGGNSDSKRTNSIIGKLTFN